MTQLSMFENQLRPQGLAQYPEFITPEEERTLLEEIQKVKWEEVRMHGVVARRRVKHYGLNYGYDAQSVSPTEPPPEYLKFLMERAAPVMGTTPAAIAEILVTEYPVGAPIGWHRDAPMFGDAIFGISLGSACVMKFRRPLNGGYEIYKAELDPRGAYVIAGPARWQWQHHIAPVKIKRWSITFRTLKAEKRK